MANLTKEERLKREAEKEAQLKAEIEEKIRKEYEEKFKDVAMSTPSSGTTVLKNKIPLNTVVCVVCNIDGRLHYRPANGTPLDWDGLGSVEYMELSELVTMRNTSLRFFEDNWIIFEDTDEYSALQLYDFLKVTKYYENVIVPENIDSIFEMDDKEILKKLSGLSKGVKDTIATRVKIKIDAKELDSNKKIEAFEQALNVKFSI